MGAFGRDWNWNERIVSNGKGVNCPTARVVDASMEGHLQQDARLFQR